ncbi:MAG: hypothetical protein WAU70_14775 [Flavobacteriales bacterium]
MSPPALPKPGICARLVVVLGLIAGSLPACGQDSLMYVYGVVKDYASGDTLKAYSVTAVDVDDSLHVVRGGRDGRGRYDLVLSRECIYAVEFSSEGFHTKAVVIDMNVPHDSIWVGGFGMNIEATLLPIVPEVDASALSPVFGRARYNSATGGFTWDRDFTEKMKAQQAAVLKAYDERLQKESTGKP